MEKYLIVLFTIGCLFFMSACSNDEEDSTPSGTKTTNPTRSDDNEDEETDTSDETGASPFVCFYSVDEEDSVKVTPGESQTVQAPLEMTLVANVSNPDNYNYVCEWRVWRTNDSGSEDNPLVTRFEEDTSYTLTKSGGYGIKLYITFSQGTDTIEYESEQISVVISESKLVCPDGFSPNGDGINDSLRITAQSIVELEATFFNRWGQKVHEVTLVTAKRAEGEPNKLILWDGKNKGKYVNDGVYFLHLYALGSDGLEYKIKKAINVLTGYRENEETSGGE